VWNEHVAFYAVRCCLWDSMEAVGVSDW
jgi:hypothetical protein